MSYCGDPNCGMCNSSSHTHNHAQLNQYQGVLGTGYHVNPFYQGSTPVQYNTPTPVPASPPALDSTKIDLREVVSLIRVDVKLENLLNKLEKIEKQIEELKLTK